MLKAKGKSYDYQILAELGHNTASIKSPETMIFAIQWIKDLSKE